MRLPRYWLLIILLVASLNAIGQDKGINFSITAGYVSKYSEAGTGWNIGFNFYGKNENRLKFDLLLSSNSARERVSKFRYFTANTLGGIRYYLIAPNKTATVYTSVLIGAAFTNVIGDSESGFNSDVGYSAGIFVNNNGLLTGISLESYRTVIVKVGINFWDQPYLNLLTSGAT